MARARRQARLSGGEFALVWSVAGPVRVRAALEQRAGGVRLLPHVRTPARTNRLVNHQRRQAIRLQHSVPVGSAQSAQTVAREIALREAP